ncbi:MAG: DUF4407 domain-containing protein [Bacteroidota bacterium]|nr:DUF4407 domain-containing protein [Bacteroidota bacterium]
MRRDFYATPKSTPLMRLLWSASGGDRYILERATYSDQIKYLCLGGIIVATGLMAALAGGYAFYTIFEPRGSAIESQFSWTITIISIFFGCFWGLMNFNLDSFIVSSTGKGDGTEDITWDELKGAIPRLVLGAIIALTISKPVEIRMFKTEIDVELHNAQMEKQKEYLGSIDKIYADRINEEKKKIEKWENDIQSKVDRYTFLENQYIEEARIVKPGPKAAAIKAQADRAENEVNLIKSKNEPLIKAGYENLEKFETSKQKDIENGEVVSAGLDGLLERIKLSHHIAGFWISLFITLLFMAIEMTPIFFKLMLVKSPYDFLKENVEELMKAEQGIHIEYNYHKDKEGQERDLVTHLHKEKLLVEKKSLQRVQEELTEYAISKYKEEMKKKIDANPEKFIKVQENNNE